MNREPPEPLECNFCHHRVGPWLYHRYIGDRHNWKIKCINCMTLDDLTWQDRMVYEWRKEHTEFNHKPISKEDSAEYVEMCKRYMKKILRRGRIGSLPYSMKDSLSGEQEV